MSDEWCPYISRTASRIWREGVAAQAAETEKLERALVSIHQFIRDHLDSDPATRWGDYYNDPDLSEMLDGLQRKDDLDGGPIPSVRAIIERDRAAAPSLLVESETPDET